MRCSILLAASLLPAMAQNPVSPPCESIIIAGAFEAKRVTVTIADLAKLPQRTVTVTTNGKESKYEGATLQSVLELVGLRFGNALRGDRLLVFTLVEGAPPPLNSDRPHEDDYRAVFSLAELDSSFTTQPAILGITRDGKRLTPPEGTFRIIAPQDRRQSRWVKDVRLIWILHADYALTP